MEDNNDNDHEDVADNASKAEKKHKIRQRKIIAELQKQIKFYFSEPNLQKDRFLRQRIAENDNGCVEVETIASFNRMKQLCGDISIIVKAMKLCPSVEVIDDKWVKPAHPLPEPKNVDNVTIYVERLPASADHDWIKSLFSSCGNVVYVSLPRYKTTRDIKGFAFVEFEKESEAEAALAMFVAKPKDWDGKDDAKTEKKEGIKEENTEKRNKKNKSRKAKPSDSENEDTKVKSKNSKRARRDEVLSNSSNPDLNIDSNPGETKEKNKCSKKENCEENDGKKTKMEIELSASDCEVRKKTKRKRKKSEANEEDGTASKRKKKPPGSDDESCTLGKTSLGTSAQDLSEEQKVDNDDDKKKRRKRKKKEKYDVEVPQLRVMSKTEWLRLKKEYQQLQRQAMKDAKQKLKIEFEANLKQTSRPKEENESNENAQSETIQTEVDKTDNEHSISNGKKELPQKLEMQPGVVLKFSADHSVDKRSLRDAFSLISPVVYLDKADDRNEGHVRFASKEACDKVLKTFSASDSVQNVKIEKLSEKEDAVYWERLNSDRIERFQHGKKRGKSKRGRQKITKKMDERNATKREHVHFDE